MADEVTIRVTVDCDFDGKTYMEYVKYPRKEWEALTSMKREIRLRLMAEDVVMKMVRVRAEVIA